jgi:hypothetical protein
MEASLQSPQSEWPPRKVTPRRVVQHPDPELLQRLREIRDSVAKDLALEPSLIATRATLTSAALTKCQSAQILSSAVSWLPWQQDLLQAKWLEAAKPTAKKP